MPNSKEKANLVEQLRKIHSDLVSKIPEPKSTFVANTGKWKITGDTIVDMQNQSGYSIRFYWKEYAAEGTKIMKWRDSGDSNLPKNSLGIFEMVIDSDRSKYDDFLAILSKGKDNVSKFYATHGAQTVHLFSLQNLDIQSACMYLITVYLPYLQNVSAQTLEEQGKTMKEVAKAYDKWNEIQHEMNGFIEIIQTLKKKDLIDQSGKLNIIDIVDEIPPNEKENYKIINIKDPDQSFKPLIDKNKTLNVKISEMEILLKDVEKKLPPSQQSLIATMKEMTAQLPLKKDTEYSFYYDPYVTSDLRFTIKEDLIKLPNNKDFDFARKFVLSTMHKEYFFMVDPDQTKFKAYMDNIAQGITALTSISNMTQQELQIATQYHNSLLGLQKSAFDSLNKTMQSILNNMR